MSRRNTSNTDAIKALRTKRGPALDKEMARRIGMTRIPDNPNARHAAAMVLTRAILSLPEKKEEVLDDLLLAIEDQNDVWIYDCLMALMHNSAGKPIRPRETESEQKDDGKIISLIPGENENPIKSLANSSEPDSSEIIRAWRAQA